MHAPEIQNAELRRLSEDQRRAEGSNWKRWGPYLSERQWGTVREDYSGNGDTWGYFPHDHARSRAYRWGEDGLMGITDRQCRLCFGLALWNGQDPILKERLFGLTGPEGNHGEDVKECYFYLNNTPTHSYMKGLYKYPQTEFPYARLVAENRNRDKTIGEFELIDTGIFDDNRYFDVYVEYAKDTAEDILIRITIANRAAVAAPLHVLPQFWFRNTWSWGSGYEADIAKPSLVLENSTNIRAHHEELGTFLAWANVGPNGEPPVWLFTDNETNFNKLYGAANLGPYCKDGFHDYVIDGKRAAVNPKHTGTKAAAMYQLTIPAGGEVRLKLRLCRQDDAPANPFDSVFKETFIRRIGEAASYYDAKHPNKLTADEKRLLTQADAGLLWTKQFYYYVVEDWLTGDKKQPQVPESRRHGRNADWTHLFNRDVISMPDKWEYPWYAAWDSAFHMIPFSHVDPHFAKEQLILFLREWYMHPNGQLPAYEYSFSDVNPPVHAWSCWRVYKRTGARYYRDRTFLARVFQKLLLNFTWWVNRKDPRGRHLFSGGFLGLDNIGVFDRSAPLPTGGYLEQADATAWMAFYCGIMLAIALELAASDPAYEDVASKFFEHYVAIADAMNNLDGTGLWDDLDGFYYDHLFMNGRSSPLRVRSIVGIIPLFAVQVLDDAKLARLPGFRRRMDWFLKHRSDLDRQIAYMTGDGEHGEDCKRRLLAIPSRERLERMLKIVLDEREFLSKYGIRSLSRVHKDRPFVLKTGSQEHRVDYEPAESTTRMFGGNSNWRGPIWFPVNYLLIESLEQYHFFYGDTFKVECPTGSGNMMTLLQVARELETRLLRLMLADSTGTRPCHGKDQRWANDPHWKELLYFHEYFDGDNGRGCGASHQTGWTALAAVMLADLARERDSIPTTEHSPLVTS